jgi:hypothetical protein
MNMKCPSYGLAFLLLTLAAPAVADDRDRNADATHAAVSASDGVLVRVPISASGNEDSDLAELRAYRNATDEPVDTSDLAALWNAAAPMSDETAAPRDSSADSSTSWWGWNRWGGWGWRNPYHYYYSYTPYFNYYGNYYNYYGSYYGSYPYYYNYYNPFGTYYGYRYYYYPRYW